MNHCNFISAVLCSARQKCIRDTGLGLMDFKWVWAYRWCTVGFKIYSLSTSKPRKQVLVKLLSRLLCCVTNVTGNNETYRFYGTGIHSQCSCRPVPTKSYLEKNSDEWPYNKSHITLPQRHHWNSLMHWDRNVSYTTTHSAKCSVQVSSEGLLLHFTDYLNG